MGHAPAQVVGAGDLAGNGGDVFQRPKQGGSQDSQQEERGDGGQRAEHQRPNEYAVINLEIIE